MLSSDHVIAVRAASVVAALLLAAPAVPAQSPFVGWTTVTRTTKDAGDGQAPDVLTRRTVRAGIRSRIETFAGDDTLVPRQVILSDSTKGALTMLTPAQRTAMIMTIPLESMDAMDSTVHSKTVGTPSRVVEDLGDGPIMIGHPTRHYRTTSHRVTHYEGPGFACDQISDEKSDLWSTLDQIGPRRPPRVRRVPTDSTVTPPLDSTAMTQERQRHVRGRPLRTETVTTTTRGHEAPTVERRVDETVELRYGPVDSTLFVVPADYRLTDARTLLSSVNMKKMFEAVAPALGVDFCGSASGK